MGDLYGGWVYTVGGLYGGRWGVYTVGGSIRWGSIRWEGLYGGSIWWGVYKGGWVYMVGGLYRGVYLVGILYGMRSIGGVYCFFFLLGILV